MRSLPRVVSSIPNDLRTFLEKVREYLVDSGENRFVTLSELRKGGIVGTTPGGTITIPTDFAVEDPVVPTNLIATGAFAIIFLKWDTPNYLGHSHTEVWAAATDDFAAKVLVGTTEANSFGHEIGTGATKYYWVRFVNTLGTAGPFNSTAGTPGTTSQDPDYLIQVLSDAYGVTGPAPFFQIDTPTVINGVTIPAGTYIKQAWIADATISRAKIQDLAVDNAKIDNLNVNKLLAGSLQVGSYIQSQGYAANTTGWRISASGEAEFSGVVVRGAVYATSGTIGGATINSTGIQSTNYSANSAGWRITGAGDAEINNLLARGTLLGGSATGYNTGGTGFFAGLDSGTYKWRVGDITGTGAKYVRWTGNNLEISTGLVDIINTPNVTDNAINNLYFAYGATSTNILKNASSAVASVTFTTPQAMTANTAIYCGGSGGYTPNGGNAEPSFTLRLITNFAFSVYNAGDPVRNITSVGLFAASGNANGTGLIGMINTASNGTYLPAGSYTLQLNVSNPNGTNTSIDVSGAAVSAQLVKK